MATLLALAVFNDGALARAQRPSYLQTSWTTEQGLPQNTVTALCQTQDGYLWIGTSGGLARFDGVKFTIFNSGNTPALRSNRISALYEDRAGVLWIGALGGGLTRYAQGSFTNYGRAEGLPVEGVYCVTAAAESEGGLWVGTRQGAAHFRDGKFAPRTAADGWPQGWVRALSLDRAGNLWLSTDKAGLGRYHPEGPIMTFTTRDGLPDNSVLGTWEGRDGTLWVGTQTGLAKLKDGRFAAVKTNDGRALAGVQALSEDGAGTMWAATNAGLIRLRGEEVTFFDKQDGLADLSLHAVLCDQENNLWIGADVGGLSRWRQGNLVTYAEAGLGDSSIASIYEDRAGKVWVGSGGQGLYRFEDGQPVRVALPGKLFGAVWGLAEDRAGNLWLGSANNGLARLSDGQVTGYTTAQGLSSNSILALFHDAAGALWVGTSDNGLNRFQDGRFTVYRTDDGLPHNQIAFITQDRHGTFWIGSPGGLTRFQDGRFTNYGREIGLALVRAIHEDEDGALWIGTYGHGLSRFKDGRFTRYTERDGLFDGVVSRILEDDDGNFWMSGNRGIFWVSRQELNDFADGKLKMIHAVSYGVADGMPTSETNGGGQPAGWKTRDGRLWFPTIKGVVAIDPRRANKLIPPVVIEHALVDRAPRPPEGLLRLAPGDDELEIAYTALSFTRPEQIRFKYQLAGLDQEWVAAGARRTVNYTHLPPGNYIFKVIASNGDGVWNTAGAELRIVVVPPFWQRWWFQALVILSLAGLMALAYRQRVRKLEKARHAQEQFARQLIASQESERKRIAGELHDSLGQNLLVIKNRALLGLHHRADHDRAVEQLDEIATATSQAIEEVRVIARNLHPYQLERLGLTKAVTAMINRVASAAEIAFTTEIEPVDGLLDPSGEINLYRIIQESLNNIVKHSGANAAHVTIKQNAPGLLIIIRDNGRGFIPAVALRQTRGLGLTGMSERARMIGGTQTIHSVPGQGTTVTIKLDL